MPLRWADLDMYGHVNNSIHYLLMDTAVNDWLAEATGTHPRELPALGVVAETGCRFLREIGPEHTPELGIRLDRLGRSSVRYGVGFFIDDGPPAALAHFVHVYVDPATRRPVEIPEIVRLAIARDLTSLPYLQRRGRAIT
jgi:acyl-CoA thioester hydrolase